MDIWLSIGLRFPAFLCMCLSQSAIASTSTSTSTAANIESLIAHSDFREASRQILQESQTAWPGNPSIPGLLIESEYFDDALTSFKAVDSVSRVQELLKCAWGANELNDKQRQQLVESALRLLSENKELLIVAPDAYASASLLYRKWNMETKARELFRDALSAANRLMIQASNSEDGYLQISDALYTNASEKENEWMIDLVASSLDDERDPLSVAVTYAKLAGAKARVNAPDSAENLLRRGFAAIGKIGSYQQRVMGNSELVKAAFEIGATSLALQHAHIVYDADVLALYYSATDQYAKADSLIATLPGPTLYVDRRAHAEEEIVRGAIARNDLRTARYYLDKSVDLEMWRQVEFWTAIAVQKARSGDAKQSRDAFDRAIHASQAKTDAQFFFHLESTAKLNLGAALIDAGRQKDGEQIVNAALLDIAAASRKLDAERVRAFADAAAPLTKSGLIDRAKQALTTAYVVAHTSGNSSMSADIERSERLANVATAMLELTANPACGHIGVPSGYSNKVQEQQPERLLCGGGF